MQKWLGLTIQEQRKMQMLTHPHANWSKCHAKNWSKYFLSFVKASCFQISTFSFIHRFFGFPTLSRPMLVPKPPFSFNTTVSLSSAGSTEMFRAFFAQAEVVKSWKKQKGGVTSSGEHQDNMGISFTWALIGSKVGHQTMAYSWEIPKLLLVIDMRSSKQMGNFPASHDFEVEVSTVQSSHERCP